MIVTKQKILFLDFLEITNCYLITINFNLCEKWSFIFFNIKMKVSLKNFFLY